MITTKVKMWAVAICVGLILAVGLVTWMDVYFFEDGSMWTTLPEEALAVRRIEAMGTDFRVYEFASETHPNFHCVFAAGDTKGGLDCFYTGPQPQAK